MDNQAVYLSPPEWQAVLAMISLAPWRDANPILMKIGEQLRTQQQVASNPPNIADIRGGSGGINGPTKEVRS